MVDLTGFIQPESYVENGVTKWVIPEGVSKAEIVAVDGQGNPLTQILTLTIPNLPQGTYQMPYDGFSSEAVYRRSDGVLVRTLTYSEPKTKGKQLTTKWDGVLDDGSTIAPDGQYEIRVLTHRMQYRWLGAIGNTSYGKTSNDTMWRAYQQISDMVEVGPAIYVARRYAEGPHSMAKFLKTAIQTCIEFNHIPLGTNHACMYVCSDGNKIYYACYDLYNTTSYTFALNASNDSLASFSSGTIYRAAKGSYDVSTIGLRSDSVYYVGNAVQKTGNYYFGAYENGTITVHNKTTGVLVRTLTGFSNLRRPKVDTNDNLWVITGKTATLYPVNADGTLGTATRTVGSSFDLLAVAVSPDGNNLTYAEGYGSQVVKTIALTAQGQDSTLGDAGGVGFSPDVESGKRFYFSDAPRLIDECALTYQSDGKLWVNDAGNASLKRFAGQTLVDYIRYKASGYTVALDATNPNRGFQNYDEFRLDYSGGGLPTWVFVKNWRNMLPSAFFEIRIRQNIASYGALSSVATFPNGTTYALSKSFATGKPTLLRFTAIGIEVGASQADQVSFGKDLALCYTTTVNGVYQYWERPYMGISNGWPTWGTAVAKEKVTGVKDTDPVDPSGYGFGHAHVKTENGTRISFLNNLVRVIGRQTDSNGNVTNPGKKYGYGWRLGGIKQGGSGWQFLGAQTVRDEFYQGPYPKALFDFGNRAFNPDGTQQGNSAGMVTAAESHILWNDPGEGWGPKGEQAFFLHDVYQSGHFLGQVGATQQEADDAGQRIGYPGMIGGGYGIAATIDPTDDDRWVCLVSEEGGWSSASVFEGKGRKSIRITTPIKYSITGGQGFELIEPEGENLLDDQWITDAEDTTSEYNGQYFATKYGTYTPSIFDVADQFTLFNLQGVTKTRRRALRSISSSDWALVGVIGFPRSFPNDGEQSDASSGGAYFEVVDSAGKILVRFYNRANNSGLQISQVFANTTKLVEQSYFTPAPNIIGKFQPLQIKCVAGQLQVQYANLPAVNITPLESGADKTAPAMIREVFWEKGVKRDRAIGLLKLLLKGGTPPVTPGNMTFTAFDGNEQNLDNYEVILIGHGL